MSVSEQLSNYNNNLIKEYQDDVKKLDDKKNEMRKPNTGMLSKMLNSHSISSFYDKDDMLMIGDASGLPGQFSNSDKKCAENFGIDYLDVSDFANTYSE